MANTFTKIETIDVGSGGASSIVFSSIPQTYTDLVVLASVRDSRSDAAWTDGYLSINGSPSGTSHSYRYLLSDGSNPATGTVNDTSQIAAWLENSAQSTANLFTNTLFYFSNYTKSAKKNIHIDAAAETNNSYSFISLVTALWSPTTAISSIYLTPPYGSYVQYSSATLYGIKSS